jgi:CRP-like cAMP-binding protein
MNFFKKISKSSAPAANNEDSFDEAAGKKDNSSKMADIEGKYTRALEDLKGARQEIDNLQSTINDKERQLNQATAELERLKLADATKDFAGDQRLEEYKKALLQRDGRINNLKAELENVTQKMNKELSALNQKMEFIMDEKDHQIKRLNALGGTEKKDGNVRTAISAETGRKIQPGGKLPKIEKTEAETEIIAEALCGNTFMKSLAPDQRQKIIDAMEKKHYQANVEIIREGTDGNHMYVLEKGAVTVTKGTGKEKTFVCDLGAGQLFGELAILYNCRRTATVKSKTSVSVWQLERVIFQQVVKSAGQAKEEERFNMISKVKELKQFSEAKLRKIADCLEEESYDDGHCIFKQGAVGDLFFVIRSGEVRVTKNEGNDEKEVAILGAGDFFGDKALISEEKRSANIYAKGYTKCYTLDRLAFINLVGKVSDDHKQEEAKEAKAADTQPTRVANETIANSNYNDLEIIKPLGAGGFGLVKLVKVKGISDRAYALKCIQKHRVVQYGQQRHIMDEKNILATMQSPFILALHKTFKNSKFVFLLTDAYLGGDLWRTLHTKGPFNDSVARFYVACVVEAFDYLHKRHYCYRDLKPENLMVDNNGYVRLVDLGFAKKVPPGHKTWTFCGTPEYIPPEIISNTGHNIAADYWSLGILIFELLSKRTPFRAKDDLAIYEGILRGIHSVQFPYKISRKAESIIKALCRQDPSERIGYQRAGVNDIRKHRWFQGFDWEGLREEKISAPHIPEIKNPFDVSNFEKIREEDERKIPEENSGWDAEF